MGGGGKEDRLLEEEKAVRLHAGGSWHIGCLPPPARPSTKPSHLAEQQPESRAFPRGTRSEVHPQALIFYWLSNSLEVIVGGPVTKQISSSSAFPLVLPTS